MTKINKLLYLKVYWLFCIIFKYIFGLKIVLIAQYKLSPIIVFKLHLIA